MPDTVLGTKHTEKAHQPGPPGGMGAKHKYQGLEHYPHPLWHTSTQAVSKSDFLFLGCSSAVSLLEVKAQVR